MRRTQAVPLLSHFRIWTTVALAVLFVLPCQADTIFSDKATFLAATGATSATGPLPNIGLIAGGAGASQTVGNVTFTIAAPSTELHIGTANLGPGCGGVVNCDWTLRLAGADIAISGVENLNAAVSLGGPVYSMGFDFVNPVLDPNVGAPATDSIFTVTLKDGATLVTSFSFGTPSALWPGDAATFVGFWGGALFDRMEIRETVGTHDNEFFGQFYTGTTPIPEPGTVLLLGSGLAGLALRRWKRQ